MMDGVRPLKIQLEALVACHNRLISLTVNMDMLIRTFNRTIISSIAPGRLLHHQILGARGTFGRECSATFAPPRS